MIIYICLELYIITVCVSISQIDIHLVNLIDVKIPYLYMIHVFCAQCCSLWVSFDGE